MLTPMLKRRCSQAKWKSVTVWRSLSAMRIACSGGQFSSSTPNSSPPSRASVSPSRRQCCSSVAHLAHELVAGRMPAGVVDDLELVKVEIHDRVVPPHLRGRVQSEAQPALELACG